GPNRYSIRLPKFFISMDLFRRENLLTLPDEMTEIILDNLKIKDIQNLSRVCRALRRVTKLYHFGVAYPVWKDTTIELESVDGNLPISNYRDGVFIEGKFYIAILEEGAPVCWILDFAPKPRWKKVPILIDMEPDQFHPVKSTSGAAIKYDIYMFGGESLLTGLPTKNMYKLNIKTMKLSKLPESGALPAPRFMHSLNAVGLHHLILFGGRCLIDNGELYDTKDFSVYDIYKNTWIVHASRSNIPYSRSLHTSTVICGKLFIYGGQHISCHSPNSSIHDDEDVWEYDFLKNEWHRYLAPTSSSFLLPKEWFSTAGIGPGKRCGSAIFPLRRKIVVLGGSAKNFAIDNHLEHMTVFCPVRKTWTRILVQGMPRLECIATKVNRMGDRTNVFVIGKNVEGKFVTGWIFD
ncbi:10526_t:CDS:2, partial [Acaulospora morrowiae]